MIWHKEYTIDELKSFITHKNIVESLGIDFSEITDEYLKFSMPVDERTHQIHGILHGGATCVLAESVGSFASLMVINQETHYAVGSQISVNHLRPAKDGIIIATCKPVHLGKTKHVWDIHIHNEEQKLIAKAELTCAIIKK